MRDQKTRETWRERCRGGRKMKKGREEEGWRGERSIEYSALVTRNTSN